MGRKKGGFASLFWNQTRSLSSSSPSPSSTTSPSSWAWPSCKHPRTQSFRAGEDIYKTVNSVYFDTSESLFTHSSTSTTAEEEEDQEVETDQSFSTAEEETAKGMETVIRGLRSDRFFFEPGGETSSILVEDSCKAGEGERGEEEEKREEGGGKPLPFKESVAQEMESEDPYFDFRVSMEEMVVAHGLKDWDCLEELLQWYLRVNGKKTHGFILGAFVDLLMDLASSSSSTFFQSSSSSCSSSSTSACCCSSSSSSSIKFVVKEEKDVKVEEGSGSC